MFNKMKMADLKKVKNLLNPMLQNDLNNNNNILETNKISNFLNFSVSVTSS